MINKDDYKILQLRNETSLCLDDLVALVVNSTLAYQLRVFSSEVMELTPGFTFNMKQATKLRDMTSKTLKQYKANAIGDVELMNYQSDAHTILKGETLQIGGNQMSFLKNIFQGKKEKMKSAMDKLESDYQDVCSKISACEEKMEQCIRDSRGQRPDSAVYRNNERAYASAKNELALWRKQELQLRKALDEAGRIELVERFAEQEKAIADRIGVVFGDDKKREEKLAKAELQSERIAGITSKVEGFGESLFSEADEYANSAVTNSEFGAMVAADERRQSMLDGFGAAVASAAEEPAAPKSEFAALVGEPAKTTE